MPSGIEARLGVEGGSLLPLRQRVVVLARAMESLDRMYPHTAEYSFCHFLARRQARRLVAPVASFPRTPSAVKTRGVKSFRRSSHACAYLSHFCFSWFASSLLCKMLR